MRPTAGPERPPLHAWVAGLCLFAGTVLLFSRSLPYGFLNYDDPTYVTANPQVQAGLTWNSIVWAFTGQSDYWHPLTWLSHMLDWQWFGDQAAGHRLVSLLWHAANAVLVFVLLRRLTGAWWTSLLAAALFAWHPLRVESVVWITERKDVMSGCFFLLLVWAHLGYAERVQAGRPARGRYALTLALYVAGLMCKPTLVMAPGVLWLLDAWPLGRFTAAPPARWWRMHRRVLLEKVPFLGLAGLCALATVLMQHHAGVFVLDLSAGARLGNAGVSVVRYLGKFFWPAELSVCYPHPGTWPGLMVAGAAGLLAGLSALAWQQRHRRPWLGVGWLWFLALLLPAIGLIQVGFQAMADRYTYLPVLGWQLALLWTLRELPLPGWLRGGTAGIALAACAAATWHQQGYWRDPLALFGRAVALDEKNSFAHGFLCHTLLDLGRLDEAARHGARALALDPANQPARYALGRVQERQGRWAEAAENFARLARLNPGQPEARYLAGRMLVRSGRRAEGVAELLIATRQKPELRQANLDFALAEAAQGRPGDALPHLEVAVAVDPRNAAARHAYAVALVQAGRLAEATAQFEATLRLAPAQPSARQQLGLLLLATRQPAAAAEHLRAALAAQPDNPIALAGLGQAEELLGRSQEADRHFAQARALAPRQAAIQNSWGEILLRRGRQAEAAELFTQVLSLQPDSAEAHAGLGRALLLGGDRAGAVAHWEQALRLRPDFPGLREDLERARP